MKKTLVVGVLLASGLSVAQASSLSIGSQSATFGFANYNGQPAAVTGTKQYGVTGELKTSTPGTISFTYLGQESSFWDSLKMTLGGATLKETDALGTTISHGVGSGSVGFAFQQDKNHDGIVDAIVTNGVASANAFAYAFLQDSQGVFSHNATIASGPHAGNYSYAYLLGFNDSAIIHSNPNGDFDDFVVGVNFTPSPVPIPAAAWLFGSALMGFMSMSNRRKV